MDETFLFILSTIKLKKTMNMDLFGHGGTPYHGTLSRHVPLDRNRTRDLSLLLYSHLCMHACVHTCIGVCAACMCPCPYHCVYLCTCRGMHLCRAYAIISP